MFVVCVCVCAWCGVRGGTLVSGRERASCTSNYDSSKVLRTSRKHEWVRYDVRACLCLCVCLCLQRFVKDSAGACNKQRKVHTWLKLELQRIVDHSFYVAKKIGTKLRGDGPQPAQHKPTYRRRKDWRLQQPKYRSMQCNKLKIDC